MELLEDIYVLTDPHLDPHILSLGGIKLGDTVEIVRQQLSLGGQSNPSGWLHVDQGFALRLDVEERRVVEFLLKPKVVSRLGMTYKRKIRKILGNPEAVEREGGTLYFYPSKEMLIKWNDDENKLVGIFLGELSIQQTEFRAKDFLRKFQEFKRMVPDHENWKARKLIFNEPRYYRLKQLLSMMKAFDLGEDLYEDIEQKRFLKRRRKEDFDGLLEDLEKYIETRDWEKKQYVMEKRRVHAMSRFPMIIGHFMRYSEQARTLLAFHQDWMEASSVEARYTIFKTADITASIDQSKLKELETIICKVLDPQERVFTKFELNQAYEYPDVDLQALDQAYK
ncbi:MAG: hypothetical protein AAFW00_12580 [Bacteroidota bacterium]